MDVGPTGSLAWGAHNLEVEPGFIDIDGPDGDVNTGADNVLQLSAISPCIDAGSNPSQSTDIADLDQDDRYAEAAPFDIAGHPRRVDVPTVADTGVGKGAFVDMGAFERP